MPILSKTSYLIFIVSNFLGTVQSGRKIKNFRSGAGPGVFLFAGGEWRWLQKISLKANREKRKIAYLTMNGGKFFVEC